MTSVCVNMYPAVWLPYYATRAQWKIFLAEGNGCVYNAILLKRRFSSHAFCLFLRAEWQMSEFSFCRTCSISYFVDYEDD